MSKDGEHVGYIFAEPEHVAARLSGMLWWQKYSEPYEFLIVTYRLCDEDGEAWDDYWSMDERLDRDLADWRAGTWQWNCQAFDCEWLSSTESTDIAQQVFNIRKRI